MRNDMGGRRRCGPRGRIGGAMLIGLLCAAGVPCAHGAAMADGTPRTEYDLAAGVTTGVAPGLATGAWPTIRAAGAYRVTRSIAVGVATGWSFVGARLQTYLAPGGSPLAAQETFALIPAVGYVRAHFPMGSHGGVPYVEAGAGSYTLRRRAVAADPASYSDTRFGFSAAIGLAGGAGMAPQVEARWDERLRGRDGFGLYWPQSRLDLLTLSLGVRLP